MTDNEIMVAALNYAKKGWYVFPCREKPGAPYEKDDKIITPYEKQPYVAHGLEDATTNEEQIRAWWTKWPRALIGVNAGKSGLFVIDIDNKRVNGLEEYNKWNINDTASLQTITPSGGMHIIFSGKGKSSTNAKTGIDTRGEGGYIIVPPSEILEGAHPGKYQKFGDWSKAPGSIPEGLLEHVFPQSSEATDYSNTVRQQGNGVRKQLSRATLTFVAEGAIPGERNSSLFRACADFAGCGYSIAETKETLLPVSRRIGLDDSEFEQTLLHAYSKPRTSSIPDEIQNKIMMNRKNAATAITPAEQVIIEKAVLAAMLMDRNAIPIVLDILDAGDFQNISHRLIFRAINRLYLNGNKIDYLVVNSEVSKETDKVGLEEISQLISDYYVNSEYAETYASIIKERSSIRKLESFLASKDEIFKKGNFTEIIFDLEKGISDIAISGGAKSSLVLNASQSVALVKKMIQEQAEGKVELLKTGFTTYDEEVGGIYSNELIVISGRPGDGKTALSLSITNYLSLVKGKKGLFFSLEMSHREIICRLVCQLTGLPYKRVYQGKLNSKEWAEYNKAMNRISESKLYFDDSFAITIPEIRSKIRKLKETEGLDYVVVDQLEQVAGYPAQPPYLRLNQLSYDLKAVTKEFDIPIFLNHQLNRNVTDRRLNQPEPQLADLSQAGEKPANQVWAIYHRRDDHGAILATKIKVLKNRNGATIEFPVDFIGERMLFANPLRPGDIFHTDEEEQDIIDRKDGNVDDDTPWSRDISV